MDYMINIENEIEQSNYRLSNLDLNPSTYTINNNQNQLSPQQNQRLNIQQSPSDQNDDNNNEVIIAVQPIISLNVIEQSQKQCRICLENQNQGKILKTCVCSGTVSYVHHKCILEWITRKHDFKSKKKVRCQLCNFQYRYKVNKNRQLSCEQFQKNYQPNKGTYRCYFSILILMILTLSLCIGIIVLSVMDNSIGDAIRRSIIPSTNIRVIYSCASFLFLNVIIFSFLLFIIEYGVISTTKIDEIQDIRDVIKLKKHQKLYPKN